MAWLQIALELEKQQLEQHEDALLNAGALSVTYTDAADQPLLEPAPGETPIWQQVRLLGLFNDDTLPERILLQLCVELNLARPPAHQFELLEDRNWVRAWMDDYQPMQFGAQLWICPTTLQPPHPEAVNLRLDPGLAFGTGTHPTTALCLSWLANADLKGKSVIDYGCGSGILAIAALLLGAKQAQATDIDPQALLATQSNAELNNVESQLNCCLVEDFEAPKSDLVMANILAGPLTELAPSLAALCTSGGQIILSGLLAEQAEEVRDVYQQWFELSPTQQQDEWILLHGTRRA
ncbi:MAG: 50S ribosomal protein L11 methyltransferase [Gammaproteobacteria bacterium]|nr:50S ribosomal protein L11 methyltransferase [Gammaproteobacteria bacterium]